MILFNLWLEDKQFHAFPKERNNMTGVRTHIQVTVSCIHYYVTRIKI